MKSPWLVGFGLVALAQLAFIALHLPRLAVIATWLLVPVVAVWVWRARGPKLLVLALMLCWAGDVLGNPALIGIGPIGLFLSVAAYAIANVLLTILFIRCGALTAWRTTFGGRQRWWAAVAVLCLVAAVVGLAFAWSSFDAVLRIVASIYLLLLVVTATTAFAVDTCAGIGAAMLLSSHLLVVLEVAGRLDGAATSFRLAVLALYALGILLIAVGVVNREPHSASSKTGPNTGLRNSAAAVGSGLRRS